MKILVTGANGYLGQGIVKKLLDVGNEVIATDINVDSVDYRAKKIACDLFECQDPYDRFERPNMLLHLAWRDGFLHYSNRHVEDLPKHYSFISKIANSDIEKVAVMGTMHEIGFFEGCIKEDTPCFPTTPYGVSKNALRSLTKTICIQNNKLFQWLRGFYIVGNTQYGSSVFSKITCAESRGEREFPFTMGQNQFDFIDYEEFCIQVSNAIMQNRQLGVINICSGFPEKLSDRAERFIFENGYNIKLKYGAFPDRPYDSKAVWGNNDRIKEIMKQY